MLSEEALSGIYKVSVLSGEEESFTLFKVEIDEPEVEEEPEVEDEEPENETEPELIEIEDEEPENETETLEYELEDGGRPEGFQLPNPSFTPGHPLYGLEMFSEEYIEIPLASLFGGPKGAAEKRLRLAEERLAEIEAIANGTNSNALERLRNRYEFQMNRTEALANRINSIDFDSLITGRTMHHIEVLTELRERLPEQALRGIDMALEASSRFFGAHMQRVAVKIQQIEGQGVNATQLKMELESLRNRVVENVMEFNDIRRGYSTSGNEIDIEIPEILLNSMGKGNNTQRGPP